LDLEGFWQENKRFVLAVGGGAIAFFVGWAVIGSTLGDELSAQRRAADGTQRKLASEALFDAEAVRTAEAQNEALRQAVEELTRRIDWRARPEFQLDPRRGAPANQYFAAVAAAREDLLRRAGRANLRVPEDLGLPALSPTQEGDIARHLAALDVIDRAVRMALESGCERIERIQIQLDPRLGSRQGLGAIERTRVAFELRGRPEPLVAWLARTQSSANLAEGGGPGGPLRIERCEMQPARNKADEAGLEVVFLVAQVRAEERAEE
jgi:hypothetical protein